MDNGGKGIGGGGASSRGTTSIWGESDPSRVSFLNWSKVFAESRFPRDGR